jgi:hypothetical protein
VSATLASITDLSKPCGVFALVWLLFTACNVAPTVRWSSRFGDETLAARAARVVAVVERGGCGGEALYEAASDDAATPEPPDLEEGRYGFRAYAVDASCAKFAEVCVERDLPLDDETPIELVLTAIDERPACDSRGCACDCAGDRCDAGSCTPSRPVELVAGGDDHTCAVVAGELYCWGSAAEGRLGTGAAASSPTPLRVGADSDWIDLRLGHNHACARKSDRSLHCWGANGAGQTGLGGAPSIGVPTRVGDASDWTAIATSAFSTCGIRGDGDLFCFGVNDNGQLGVGDTVGRDAPTAAQSSDVTEVALGTNHACVLAGAGELSCYGGNDAGMTTGPMPGPILEPLRVAGAFDAVLASANTSCGRRGAELLCWGANGEGQLGLGDRDHRRSPTSLGSIEFLSSGLGRHACTITGGTRACFGNNNEGAVGIGTAGVDVLVPQSLDGELIEWSSITTGYRHTCGIDERGALFCWGENDDGQIGSGTIGTPVLAPARVCFP